MSELNLDDAFAEPEKVEVETKESTEVETEETAESEEPKAAQAEAETEETPKGEDSTTESKESWTFSQAMDEREKRQKAVAEAAELREKLAKYEKSEDVSIFDNEAKFLENQEARLQEQLTNTTLNMSQAFAEEVFGADKVTEAVEWFKAEGAKSPYVMSRYSQAKLPYHEIVKMFDDEQARLDPETYKAKLKAEVIEELKGETEKEEREPITPSLASKRSTGKSEPPEDYEDMLGD